MRVCLDAQGLADAGEDVFAFAHRPCYLHHSRKLCFAMGGKSRVFVHDFAGSTAVPLTRPRSFIPTRLSRVMISPSAGLLATGAMLLNASLCIKLGLPVLGAEA